MGNFLDSSFSRQSVHIEGRENEVYSYGQIGLKALMAGRMTSEQSLQAICISNNAFEMESIFIYE